jgi:hypothetical protein
MREVKARLRWDSHRLNDESYSKGLHFRAIALIFSNPFEVSGVKRLRDGMLRQVGLEDGDGSAICFPFLKIR